MPLQHPFIKGVVGWVDLVSENVDERIKHYASNPLFKGVRHIAQAEKNDYFLRADVQRGIRALSAYKLCFDVLIYPEQLPAAIQLVEQLPEQQFVLDHIAKPKISEPISKEWSSNIERLSKNTNVYCKISGLVTETENFKFKEEDFIPYFGVHLSIFWS